MKAQLGTISLVVEARPANKHGDAITVAENGRPLAAQYLREGPPRADEGEKAVQRKTLYETISWKIR